MDTNRILMIDPATRKIEVPEKERLIGVYQDHDSERKYFKCPRIVGDNVDLSQHRIYVNYVPSKINGTFNEEEEVGSYLCEDVVADGDYVTFSWKISENVTRAAGYIAFAVYAKKADADGKLKTKWHTTPAIGNVLDTLPDGDQIVNRYPDVIEQIMERLDKIGEIDPEQIAAAVEEYMEANPSNSVSYEPQVLTDDQKAQARENIGAEVAGTAESKVSTHNTDIDAHNDIRLLVEGLKNRLNALADSDDTTLDQMSEIVAYIKSNKSLIDAITTSKVSVSDIIDNLYTNVSDKPLSAAQGVALKAMIDGIVIPEKLPNPQKLTFAGAVTAEYDGSGAVTVTIPEGSEGENPTDEQVASAVSAWLDDHPEATTTVEDESINEDKLADRAVTPIKTNFMEFSHYSANLFDKTAVTMNAHRYQSSPWDIMTSDTNCLSDFIPVEAGKVYIRGTESFMINGEKSWQYTYFADADKNFLSSLRHYPSALYSQSFTTPENCAYVQMSMPMTSVDAAMLCEGDTEPSMYVPYKEFYKFGDNILIGVDNFENLQELFEAIPDEAIGKKHLSSDVVESLDSVDKRINIASQWNDINQPSRTLVGRINVFDHAVKGVMHITSDISDQTVIVHGVNYFDLNDLVTGTINTNTGAITTNNVADKYTSHFIPIQPGKKLYWNRNNADGVRSYLIFHLYDRDQQWIRSKVVGGNIVANSFIPEEDACFLRVSCNSLIDSQDEKLLIADVDVGNTLYNGYDGSISIDDTGSTKTYFGKNVYFPYIGYRIENGVLIGSSGFYTLEEITHFDVFDANSTVEVSADVAVFDKDKLHNVVLKYGRYGDTDYVIVRIFKNTIASGIIRPRVVTFNPGGKTIADYAKEKDFVMAINAGIFNTDDNSCLGTTISDGVVITDHIASTFSGMGDTLAVDSNGDFVSQDYSTTTDGMLAAGITQAVNGWATIIDNFERSDLDALKEVLYPADGTYGTDYIVTYKHPRTAVGQFKNGDYMVFACGGRETNQAGMTLEEMQDVFVTEGVKFAYNLDGGGSCNAWYYKKELAPYTENRADPSYIVFD